VRSLKLKALAVALLVFAVTFHTSEAAAQDAEEATPVTSDGHRINGNVAGTIGLGLLGAELGLILVPSFGLHEHWWAWALFPAVGAAGGAVAGALTFDPHSPGPAVTATLMGAGLALAIPAIVGAVAIRDRRTHRSLESGFEGGGAIRLSKEGTKFRMPNIVSAPVYTQAEQQRYGVAQRSSMQVSLVSGRF
jgi:hypothetical protein